MQLLLAKCVRYLSVSMSPQNEEKRMNKISVLKIYRAEYNICIDFVEHFINRHIVLDHTSRELASVLGIPVSGLETRCLHLDSHANKQRIVENLETLTGILNVKLHETPLSY
ncbi:hypothetical protein CANCADRAFT_82444 [Tortispora caseinolytica NRRL Y-17796]|uniref:Uncharacterized protein n=1 Tax=Tortispora caseinolytica NRRL Y-17796 TaxID=767744 RepID=A0A1E4TK14_9ASCO|nr:hypothetical protein CANCADRAFT_82444 [Tortispora caseinolytica NRRL Y-17796]